MTLRTPIGTLGRARARRPHVRAAPPRWRAPPPPPPSRHSPWRVRAAAGAATRARRRTIVAARMVNAGGMGTGESDCGQHVAGPPKKTRPRAGKVETKRQRPGELQTSIIVSRARSQGASRVEPERFGALSLHHSPLLPPRDSLKNSKKKKRIRPPLGALAARPGQPTRRPAPARAGD